MVAHVGSFSIQLYNISFFSLKLALQLVLEDFFSAEQHLVTRFFNNPQTLTDDIFVKS
jgi:hypothetical protein